MILNKIPSALLILGTSLCFATIGPSNVLDHNTEKDTGTLYQDTSKNINQSISLHNNAAEPAKVITTTEIRRVPRYSYYNVYKTRTVWKCLPNGGGGGGSVLYTWSTSKGGLNFGHYTGTLTYSVSSGNAFTNGWSISLPSNRKVKISGPCGASVTYSLGFGSGGKVCGVDVSFVAVGGGYGVYNWTISAGSYTN